jgi:hypothetical protein
LRIADRRIACLPPGFYYSTETIACEQEKCPAGSGRNYTLECVCPEGKPQRFEERTNPANGQKYSIMVGCGATGIRGWWQSQSTGVKVAVVAGGIGVLVVGAVAAGLLTWAGIAAAGGAAAAGLVTASAEAATFVTMWVGEKAVLKVAKELAKRCAKYLVKKLGRKPTQTEVKSLMLQLINKELAKRGLQQWTMQNFETVIWGIDLIW